MLTLTALALAYALAPTRPRAPQPLAYALVSSSRPRAPPPLALAGRGFGPQAAPVPSLPTTLDADAQALLDESGGDATKARTSMMGYTLAYVAEEMPELYAALKEDPKRPDAHAALRRGSDGPVVGRGAPLWLSAAPALVLPRER